MGVNLKRVSGYKASLARTTSAIFMIFGENREDQRYGIFIQGLRLAKNLFISTYFHARSVRGLILWQPACFSYPGSVDSICRTRFFAHVQRAFRVFFPTGHTEIERFMKTHHIGWSKLFGGTPNHYTESLDF